MVGASLLPLSLEESLVEMAGVGWIVSGGPLNLVPESNLASLANGHAIFATRSVRLSGRL